MIEMTTISPSMEVNRAIGTAITIKESFSGNPPSMESFGANLSPLNLKIQQFNLTGQFIDDGNNMNFLQFLEAAGQSLNRDRIFDYLTEEKSDTRKNDLNMMVECVRSMDPSIVSCIDNFLKLCGVSITSSIEESRRKNLILAFAEAFSGALRFDTGSSSSIITMAASLELKLHILTACTTGNATGSRALGHDNVRLVADICFAILLLAQAFHKGIYFDEVLLQDFHGRINAIEVGNIAVDVPFEAVKGLYNKVKSLESISIGVMGTSNFSSPSYLFYVIEHKDDIDWSFNDGAALNNHMAVATNDAIYIFDSSDSSRPSYCIPYLYVRFELEDANTNILHLYPLIDVTFPVISLGGAENAMKSTVYYTSSTWIEFDTTAIAIKWISCLEKFSHSLWGTRQSQARDAENEKAKELLA